MQNRIVLIPCGAKKKDSPSMAWEMYIGNYFRALLNYAVTLGTDIRIISAGYGILKLNDVIEPYDITMSPERRKLIQSLPKNNFQHVLSLLPKNYLKAINYQTADLMYPSGMGMGSIISYVKKQTQINEPILDLSLLKVGNKRRLLSER